MKIAFLSESIPPAKNGQAMVLYRLLQSLSPQDYCLISAVKWVDDKQAQPQQGTLPSKYYWLLPHFHSARGVRYSFDNFREDATIPLGIISRARQVADIIKHEKCDVVVGCTGDVMDLPAGYLASRRVGVPFYAYIFDHYSYREWHSSARRFWAKRLEPWLMKGADGVIAPNEVLHDDLRLQYGVEAAVIHNSFNIAEYEDVTDGDTGANDSGIRIVYTGDIYEAHYDAFRNLLVSIERLGRPDVKLHLYTARSPEQLAEVGISGRIVCHKHHSPSEMPQIQRRADILFLPLAFTSPYPDLVRTSATTKLGEYLGARRPVLVHAPFDSFIAWYIRKYRCGLVVDKSDPTALAQAIESLLQDKELQQELGARAWERAQADFSILTARAKFMKLISHAAA